MSDGSTSVDFTALCNEPRLLMEAHLKPVQGARFQPTGFADLGAARYTLHDGTEMLLVESPQSVANRMELACWDEQKAAIIEKLKGLPYVCVKRNGAHLTNSIIEAHRINSEYIMGTGFKETFTKEVEIRKDGPIDWKKFRQALLKYDVGSLVHGAFLEEIDGRLRVTRAISGFIEARGVHVAESGGVKNNFVQPTLKQGEGNVPFHRTEFTAEEITAYFNLDLALLRGYGLGDNATNLLITLALFKVRRFLSTGLRLRTACDLEMKGDLSPTRPTGFSIPGQADLLKSCTSLIKECSNERLFADPAVTTVIWEPANRRRRRRAASLRSRKAAWRTTMPRRRAHDRDRPPFLIGAFSCDPLGKARQ